MPQNWDVWYIIQQGGPVMWPIMLCSIVVMAISIERFFTLRKTQIDTRDFMDTIRTVLRQNRVQEALDICEEAEGPIVRIVKAGLLKHKRSKEDIREAIEDAGRLEVPTLERRLSSLATCASVAPLLGLLGTVQGMIVCFAQIQYKKGQVNPADLADGMANALITTAAGLVIAIPALVVYNYFVSRVDSLVL